MELHFILVVLIVFFISAVVKGVTGLGFMTCALSLMSLLVGLKAAIPLLFLPSLFSTGIMMIEVGHFKETLKRFWILYLSLVPGIIFGLFLLSRVDSYLDGAILGGLLLIYSLCGLFKKQKLLPMKWERPMKSPVGLLNGFINGLTGSQLLPVVPYLMSLGLDKNRFIQASNMTFFLSSLLMVGGLSKMGMMTLNTLIISLIGLLPVWVGVKIGGRLRRVLSQDTFTQIVLIMLVIISMILILEWLLS